MIDDASLLMMDSRTLGLLEVESLRDIVVKYQPTINDHLLEDAKKVFEEEEVSAEAKEYKVYPAEEETSGDLLEYLSEDARDRKSTRLNSSHVSISYAVFC